MIDRLIEDEASRSKLLALISRRSLPFRAAISDGRPRSHDQNSLMWLWASEAAAQRGDVTVTEVQCEWKLLLGIPILASENEAFAAAWLPVDVSRTYTEKLNLMQVISVTSLMNVGQLKRFLNDVQRSCAETGIELTDPEEARHGPKSGSRVARRDAGRGDPGVRKAKDRPAPRRTVR